MLFLAMLIRLRSARQYLCAEDGNVAIPSAAGKGPRRLGRGCREVNGER